MNALFSLPEGWVWATVHDVVVDAQSGFASGKKNVRDGIKHLRMNNISEACTLDLASVITVPKGLAKPRHILRPGDVIFCHTNSLKLVGKTALFDRADGAYAFSNHLTRLRVAAYGPPPEWLWYWLATLWRQRYFETRAKQWVNQATIQRDTLLSTPIPVAPLIEQQRIVAHINRILALNRVAKTRLERFPILVRQFRKSILEKAFRGELTERSPNDEPASVLLERVKNGKGFQTKETQAMVETLPSIPSSWKWTTLGTITDVEMGTSPPGSSYNHEGIGTPLLNGPTEFGPKYPVPIQWTTKPTKTCVRNDILICVRGNTTGRMNFADRSYCIGRGLAAIRPVSDVIDRRLIFYFLSHKTSEVIERTTGSTFPNLPKERLRSFPIPLPPPNEQAKLVSTIEVALDNSQLIEKSSAMSYRLAELLERSVLMRAFHGELVPHTANDEPPFNLLEKVKDERESRIGHKSRTVANASTSQRVIDLVDEKPQFPSGVKA